MIKRFFLLAFFVFVYDSSFSQSKVLSYIEEYKDLSIRLMNENHIPASIILGVAIHESGFGTSKISHYLNNHFGVKGTNHSKVIKSSYKGYSDPEQSYKDFISIMKSRPKFSILFDKYDNYNYSKWAYGIGMGGYAASKTWADQVIAIIDKYKLFELDNPQNQLIKPVEISALKKDYVINYLAPAKVNGKNLKKPLSK